jgi:pimeloyl-ACP methyl ester carboxylesterase
VIHGAEDPLVPVAAGHDLARHIPGARLHVIPGMGHDLPPALLPTFTRLIARHAGEAEQAKRSRHAS